MMRAQVMEAGDTDLNSLLAGYSGLELSLNRVRYIWEQVRRFLLYLVIVSSGH